MSTPDLPPPRLEALLTRLLFVGGAVSTGLLLAGLGLSLLDLYRDASELLLNLGLVTLMATPILRVAVSVVEYVRERDWWFALATVTVLATLFLSIWIALSEAVR
jgi:uncharacterized membrane protein